MKVFGLIGERLSHSLSPIIHRRFYELLNIDGTYSLYQVKPDSLRDAVEGIKALDVRGANVTIPYKVKIMAFLDSISEEAQKIGAINTIYNDGHKLKGFNTDYTGFGRMLEHFDISARGNNTYVLGSGGAAKAIAAYLQHSGASDIVIVTRDPDKVVGFDKSCKVIAYKEFAPTAKTGVLINCTPVGMYPNIDASAVAKPDLMGFQAVVDLIYNPSETKLMQYARESGILTYNGLYMLVSQAASAIEIWNDIHITEETINKVYEELIDYMNK